MNNQQLKGKLRSIGMWCFVKYFDEFCDSTVPKEDVATLIVEDNPERELKWGAAVVWRVNFARDIIKAGRALDALDIVRLSESSKVSAHTKERAAELAARLRKS